MKTTDTDPVNLAEDAVVLAEAKEAELKARLELARETVAANRKRAHELAFAAEAGDDVDAKRLSGKLLGDATKLEDEIKHRLEPAVAEAGRRVTAAKDAAARETKRRDAERAHVLANRLEELGAAMDTAFRQAAEAKGEFETIMLELRRIGAGTPSTMQTEVNINRAIDTSLSGIYGKARPVPPLQRIGFAKLFGGWSCMTLNWSAAILAAPERPGRAA